jgi:phosphatidylglycerophosphatase A
MLVIDRLCVILATGLGISYIVFFVIFGRKWTGSGLLGSVEGLGLWFLLPRSVGWFTVILVSSVLLSCWICGRADQVMGSHDNPRIVLDEIVGVWIAVAGLTHDALSIGLAFMFFRFFDSVKLPPYRWLERLPGGWGVVADDLGAGVAASLATRLILWRWGWT